MGKAIDRAELKARILRTVENALEPLTERRIAALCDQVNVKGCSAVFSGVMEQLLSNGQLKLDDRPIYKHPRVLLGDRPIPESRAFLPPPEPPLKVWVDPSVIERPRAEPRGDRPVEVVKIKVPKELKTAAKAMDQPVQTTTIKRYEGAADERAIAAWADLVVEGKPFTRTKWCTAARLATGVKKGRRWVKVYAAVDDAIQDAIACGWRTPPDENLVRDMLCPVEVKSEAPVSDLEHPDFACPEKACDEVMSAIAPDEPELFVEPLPDSAPPVEDDLRSQVEQLQAELDRVISERDRLLRQPVSPVLALKAEAEALDRAIAMAVERRDRAQAEAEELSGRLKAVEGAIAALEGVSHG